MSCESCGRIEADRDKWKQHALELRKIVQSLTAENERLLHEQGASLFKHLEDQGWRKLDADVQPEWQKVTHLYNIEKRTTYCGIKMDEQADGSWRDGQPSELSVSPCKACIKARMKSDDDEEGSSAGFSTWQGSY